MTISWIALLGLAIWGGTALWIGYFLGLRRGAKLWEDVVTEERAERRLNREAKGRTKLSRVNFTR